MPTSSRSRNQIWLLVTMAPNFHLGPLFHDWWVPVLVAQGHLPTFMSRDPKNYAFWRDLSHPFIQKTLYEEHVLIRYSGPCLTTNRERIRPVPAFKEFVLWEFVWPAEWSHLRWRGSSYHGVPEAHKFTASISLLWVNYLVGLVFCSGKTASMTLSVPGNFCASSLLSCHYLLPKHSQSSLQFKALNLLKYKHSWESNTVSMISHLHLRLKESFLRIGWIKKKERTQRKKWIAHFKRVFGKGEHTEMRPSRANKVWSPLVPSGMIMKVLYLASGKEEMAGAMTAAWGNTNGRSQLTHYFRA